MFLSSALDDEDEDYTKMKINLRNNFVILLKKRIIYPTFVFYSS